MKKIMLAAVIPATIALAACGGAATTEDKSLADAAVLEDDNDAPEPVAEPIPEEEPHDESVPHDH